MALLLFNPTKQVEQFLALKMQYNKSPCSRALVTVIVWPIVIVLRRLLERVIVDEVKRSAMSADDVINGCSCILYEINGLP